LGRRRERVDCGKVATAAAAAAAAAWEESAMDVGVSGVRWGLGLGGGHGVGVRRRIWRLGC
jgi:hypothetical protein